MTAAKRAKKEKDESELTIDIKSKATNREDRASMFKTSFREAVPFLLLIGSWIWFFSGQSAEIKLNSRSIEELSVALKNISGIVTEYRIKSSSVDEHLRNIDSSLVEIKNSINK